MTLRPDARRIVLMLGVFLIAARGFGADNCICSFTVFSSNRFMSGKWALECNGHGGHGVCSTNVDDAHSPGTGAMTGSIDLQFGNKSVHKDCPDDQTTCFRGPSTDHPGAWGNVCNCDTVHSQTTNPELEWYAGNLTHAPEVSQLTTNELTIAGACSGKTVSVSETIKEHDPFCCDDLMGTIQATILVANGSGSSSVAASTQNCNGGSQSGVPPNCGTFGATLRIAYTCRTEFTGCVSKNFFGSCPSGTTQSGCNLCCSPTTINDCYAGGGVWDGNAGECRDPSGVCYDQQYPCNGSDVWNEFACGCTNGTCNMSPILVDVLGDGFRLTDLAGGVAFDLDGDGTAENLSWTEPGTDDAWLAFDRDGDGRISKGAELFGNFTYQPEPAAAGERNGFLALAEFDRPAGDDNGGYGGNGDGVIDSRDAIFPHLRLWQDADHDGSAEPGELRTLQELGIATLELRYRSAKRTDEHGNQFRYRAKVKDGHGAQVGRWAWDVFLVDEPR